MQRWSKDGWAVPSLCVELGAGCGLPGLVLDALGAERVVLTDRPDNLRLLRTNARPSRAEVVPLAWGGTVPEALIGADLIVATDVLYSHRAVWPLVRTLDALARPHTAILLAAGRNRQAADTFFSQVRERWTVEAARDLDPLYSCDDVDVWWLRRKYKASVMLHCVYVCVMCVCIYTYDPVKSIYITKRGVKGGNRKRVRPLHIQTSPNIPV